MRTLRMTKEQVAAHQRRVKGEACPPAAKPRKYRNTPVVDADGFRFDSAKEYRRYGELRLLAQAGRIQGLDRQVPLGIYINERHVSNYLADFVYQERDEAGRWTTRVEDVKSPATRKNALYRLKKCCIEAQYGLVIREV